MVSIIDEILKIHQPRPRYKVISEITKRWSPRHYSDEIIPIKDINIIFEAARWAPSAHNHQPWYFYFAKKGTDAFNKLFSTLDKYSLLSAARTRIITDCVHIKGKFKISDMF